MNIDVFEKANNIRKKIKDYQHAIECIDNSVASVDNGDTTILCGFNGATILEIDQSEFKELLGKAITRLENEFEYL